MAKTKTPTGYEAGKTALADLLAKPVTTPLQTVAPVVTPPVETPPAITSKGEKPSRTKEKKANPHEGEEHVNFWTEQEVFNRLKVHAALSRKTIRQICTEALDQYLKQHDR